MSVVFGGLVGWEPAAPVTEAAVRTMATAVPATAPVTMTGGRGWWSFSAGGDDAKTVDGIAIVADVDLTNDEELRALTGARTTAGMLAALYRSDGPAFVSRLRGAFAFALTDRDSNTVMLAVDQFGMKRLHYVTDEHRTAFASRGAVLRRLPQFETSVDLGGVFTYLNFGFVPAGVPIIRGVMRVPPGHTLIVRDGRAVLEPYWDVTYDEGTFGADQGARALYRSTEEAVGRALQGLVVKHTGAFLSGGTDSSTVVGLMSRLTGERINTFSIGFGDQRYNELEYAELTARHFKTAHYTHVISPKEAFSSLPSLVDAYDEPFGNNSAIGTLFCAQLARQCGVTWLLAGDGGDEIFGGNERYVTDVIFARYHTVPGVLRRRVVEPLLFRLPDGRDSVLGRAQRYVRRANLPNPRRFYSYEFFFAQHAATMLSPDFVAAVASAGPYTVLEAHYDRVRAASELNRLLYLDLKLTIGDNDLFKVTRTADVAGVGVRFPLLDLWLVEVAGTMPTKLKVRGTEKRYLFKRAFAGLLPAATLTKRKHGFGVPTSAWLRTEPAFRELGRDTLLSRRATQRGIFQREAIERLFTLHDTDPTPYYGDLLWTALMLELWYGHHVDTVKVSG